MVTHIIFVYKQKQMVPHNLRRKKSETERERERFWAWREKAAEDFKFHDGFIIAVESPFQLQA